MPKKIEKFFIDMMVESLNKYIKENISILDPFNEIYFIVLIKSF